MEPLHFDLPDFDPTDGRAREGRNKFPEDESNAAPELELERRLGAGRTAGRSAPDTSGTWGGGSIKAAMTAVTYK